MKQKKNILAISLAALLIVCGCAKKEVNIDQLPPDPEACAAFGNVEEATSSDVDMEQMAQLGCLRKINEWSVGAYNSDARVVKLLAASVTGDVQTVQKLLSSGINMHRELAGGVSVYEFILQMAASYGKVEVVQELLKDTASFKELMQNDAIAVFRVVFSLLIAHDERDGKVDEAALDIIRALGKNGFDVNKHVGNCNQQSLWTLSRARSKSSVIQELEKMGYQVTQQDKNWALWLAADLKNADGTRGNVEVVKSLVKEGADVNGKAASCLEQTIYEQVKGSGSAEMIALFKQLGAHD